MAKLKKSIKAIIISICAVVVLAGSIVGAVFANKNKGGGDDKTTNPPTQQQTPTGPSTPTTPVVPEISFVGSQVGLMQTINQSNTDIEVIEKLDNEVIEKGNFNVSDIVEISDHFVIVKQNGARVVYLYSIGEQTVEINPLEDVLNIETDYTLFTVFESKNDCILIGYSYYENGVNYHRYAVVNVLSHDEVVIVNDFKIQVTGASYLINEKYTDFDIKFKDNYYAFFFTYVSDGEALTDVFVYPYTRESVSEDDEIVYHDLKDDDYDFESNYYYVYSGDNVSCTYFNSTKQELVTFEHSYSEDCKYSYNIFDEIVFVTEKKVLEQTSDLTEKSVYDEKAEQYYEYAYKLYNSSKNEVLNIELAEGVVKLNLAHVLKGKYIAFSEQTTEEYKLNEEKNIVYYDIESFEKIVSYKTKNDSDLILYAGDKSIVTKSGIYRFKDGEIVETIITFADSSEKAGLEVETVNFVNDKFVVFDKTTSRYYVMNMNGEAIDEKTYTGACEYSDGRYIFVDNTDDVKVTYLYDIKTGSLTPIQNFDNDNLDNTSMILVGFGYYFTKDAGLYNFYNYKGELIISDATDYELSNAELGSGTGSLLTISKGSDEIYYFNKEVSISSSGASQGANGAGAGMQTQPQAEPQNYFVKTKSTGLYADTPNGNSAYYVSGSLVVGAVALTQYDGYTYCELATTGGILPTGGTVTCVGDGNEDAGFNWSFTHSGDTNGSFTWSSGIDDSKKKDMSLVEWYYPAGFFYGTCSFYYENKFIGIGSNNAGGELDADATNSMSIECMPFVATLDKQGGSGGSDSFSGVYATSMATSITRPDRIGYTFGGYYSETGGSGDQIVDSSGNVLIGNLSYGYVTIYAKWTANSYTVSYELDGGTSGGTQPTSWTYGPAGGAYDKSISNPTKTGYTFNGWTIENMSTNCTHYWGGYGQGSNASASGVKADAGYLNLRSSSGEVKFTATWLENKYTITFNLNNPNTYTNDISTGYSNRTPDFTDSETINNPVKTGYTFTGWTITGMSTSPTCNHEYGSSTTADSSISSTKATSYKKLHVGSQTASNNVVTFTANWTKNTYSIKYVLGTGGKFLNTSDDQPTSATYDVAFHVTDPVKKGYTFSSWSITNASDKGAMNEEVIHNYGTTSSASSTFKGTSKASINVEYFKNLRHAGGEVTLTANWTKTTYTVTFNLNNPNSVTGDISSINNKTGVYDECLTVSEIPTKTGYLFTHWSISGMDTSRYNEDTYHYHHETETTKDKMNVVKSQAEIGNTTSKKYMNLHSSGGTVTFKANWKPIQYTISYSANGGDFGSISNPTSKKYDEDLNVTNPLKHGYDFTGWTITSSKKALKPSYSSNSETYTTSHPKAYPQTRTDNFKNITISDGDTVTFTAQWTPAVYKIKFVYNNPTKDDETKTGYKYDTEYTIDNPKRMGYIFDYWTLSACSSCDVYDFTCKHKHGSTEFSGTSISNVTSTKFKNLHCVTDSVVTFTASWHAKTYYLINEAAGYGSTLEKQSVKYDEWFYITAPTSSPLGYHFSGWKVINMNKTDENTSEKVKHYYGANTSATTYVENVDTLTVATENAKYYFKNLSSNSEASVTIQPQWTANTYVVTFDMNNPNWFTNDITVKSDYTATYDTAFSVTDPTKTGYSFTGWSLMTLSDDCVHYFGTSTSACTTAFESLNGRYNQVTPSPNPNYLEVVKKTAFKNLRSDRASGIKAVMIANWKANKYTITYHYLPESFDVTAYELSQLNTHVNLVSQMTASHTQEVTYDKIFEATNYKRENGELIFGLPIGLRLITWGMVSGKPAGTTKTAKYNSSNVIETNFTGKDAYNNTISADIYPYEEQIFGVGENEAEYTNWIYFTTAQINAGIHLYAAYDLAGINLRYYVPKTAAGSNFLQNYVNVENSVFGTTLAGLNTNKKYTEVVTLADNANIPNYQNLVGWMIVQTYDSSGELTKDSLTRYAYQSTTYVAYKGNEVHWGFTNVDAYSYEDPTYFLYAVYDEVYSGDFGDLTFTYNSTNDGFVVKGKGSSYVNGSVKIPAYYDNGTTGFKKVYQIGSEAFNGYTNLTSVHIPSTVVSIAYKAFYNCDKLASISLPSNLTTIDSYAFYDCDKIPSLTTPSTLKTIGGYAFYHCDKLATVTLNEGLTKIDDSYAFYYCPITSITIPSTLTFLGVGTFEWTKLTSITIPRSVQELRGSTFWYCQELTTVTFESNSSVSSIGSGVFAGCVKLTSISLPNSVKSIGGRAFELCSAMTSITMPDALTSLGESAFLGCAKLTSIVMPKGLTAINNKTFQDCVKLTSVKVYDGITSIGEYAFDNCAVLTSLTIPDTVTTIGKGAFRSTAKLASLSIPFVGQTRTATSNTYIGYMFGASKYEDNGTSVPSTLKTLKITDASKIAVHALYGLSNLTSLTISNSVTEIGEDALAGTTALTTLSVPFIGKSRTDSTYGYIGYWYDVENTTYVHTYLTVLVTVKITGASAIQSYALYGADNTTSLTLNEGITTIGDCAFTGIGISTLVIPSTVTSIGNGAFAWSEITYVNLNEGLETISEKAFYECGLLTSITVPSTVTSMGSYVFANCEKLASAVILDGTTSIGEYAFNECTSLTTVRLPKTITAIPAYMFAYCSALTTVHIQEGITSIGNYAFRGIAATTVKLPSTLTTIGGGVFCKCENLTSIVIPNSVTTMSWDVFYQCTSLTKIVIPNSVTTIGSSMFYGCTSLVRAELSTAITSIGTQTFYGCTALTTVIFHKGVTSVGQDAFYNCTALKYVYYGGTSTNWSAMSINSTGNSALKNTTNGVGTGDGRVYNYDKMVFTYTGSSYSIGGKGSISDALVIPYYYDDGVNGKYKVDEIVNKAYYGHTSLTSVQTSNQIKIIGDSAFSGCTALTSCTFSTALTSIGSFAFYNCEKLTSATVPAAITVLNRYTFYGCKALTSLTFSSTNTLTKIDEHAVDYCIALTTIKIPDSVTFIGTYAFSSCSGLDGEIKLPSGLKVLAKGAFYYCTSLDKVELPDSLTVLDERVFAYCSNLANIYIPASIDTISAAKYDIAPLYSVNRNCMVFCEDLGKQAGWGPYWNYSSSSRVIWTFYDYNSSPDVYLKNDGGWTMDSSGNLVSPASGGGYLYFKTLNELVNVRFEYKSTNTTIIYRYNRDAGGCYNTLKDTTVGEYKAYNMLMVQNDEICFGANVASTITLRNIRFDTIISGDYCFEEEVLYDSNGHDYDNVGYRLKSTNKGDSCHNTSSSMKLIANDDIEVNFEYFVSSECNMTNSWWYDYLIVTHNSTEIVKYGGTAQTSYIKANTISMKKGDTLEFRYRKDGSQHSGNDEAIIQDLQIKTPIYFKDDTDLSQNVAAASYSYTFIDLYTQDGWEIPYKYISTSRYNAKIVFKYRVYQDHSPLSGYSGARIQILNTVPTASDCSSIEITGATMSTTQGVYLATITIPNPGGYYLALNFGRVADYQNLTFDIGCVYSYGFFAAHTSNLSDFTSSNCLSSSFFYERTFVDRLGYLTPSNGRSSHLSNTSYSFMTEISRSYVLTAPYSMLLSFQYYYATESNYDYVRFYINDSLIFNKSGNDATWRDYSISLNKGDVFKITYYHDTSYEDYIDGYYIRNIEMTRIFGFVKTATNVYESENVGTQNSEAVIVYNYTSSGTLSFNYTLSSETYNDRLYVYVDGVCVHKSYALTSGTNGSFSQYISAGSLVKIVYVKDSTVNKNNDKVTITFTSKPY